MSDEGEQNSAGVKMPVNPDGTTNWKAVFEDPERGILNAVASTRSNSQLRAVLASVAPLLFKRKRDAKPRNAFLSRMNTIIDIESGGDFDTARATITELLQAEKDLRIEKAAIYAKNKAAGLTIERRRKSTRESLLAAIFANPVRLAVGIVAILILLTSLGGVVVYLNGNDTPDTSVQKETKQPAEKPVEKPKTPAPAPKVTPPPVPEIKRVAMLALKPLPFRLLNGGATRLQTFVPLVETLIEAPTEDDEERLCGIAPLVLEGVTFGMRAASQAGREFSESLLAEISAKVRRDILRRPGAPKIGALTIREVRSLPSAVLLAAYSGCKVVMIEIEP